MSVREAMTGGMPAFMDRHVVGHISGGRVCARSNAAPQVATFGSLIAVLLHDGTLVFGSENGIAFSFRSRL